MVMPSAECPFCLKLAHVDSLSREELVWQFPHSIALLGPWQYYLGYCTLVARRHASELSQLSESERIAYFNEMCWLAKAIEAAFHPRKLNYELLGNQVPHLHWHLFARYDHDPDVLKPVWLRLERAERDETERLMLQTGLVIRSKSIDLLQGQINALGL
jgi:diadenosine tetraphosphate (Ap4A) HIT family hydrolase